MADNLTRRQFVQIAGLSAASFSIDNAMAGPFAQDDFNKLVPADKRLTPAWLKSLTDRDKPEIWTDKQHFFIGMPVGGIGCGQLYLGGEGKLWNWQIFQSTTSTDYEGKIWAGPHYEHPMKADNEVKHGFSLMVEDVENGKARSRMLDLGGLDSSFRGEYPIGRITHHNSFTPVQVSQETFTPYIPLDIESSSIPATVISFKLRNTGKQPVKASIIGHLENAVCREGDGGLELKRVNKVVKRAGYTAVMMAAERGRAQKPARDEIVYEDFEGDTWGKWKAEGNAFGVRPYRDNERRFYTALQGFQGHGFANSHHMRNGEDAGRADSYKGKLISPEFTIERNFIRFLIGGGKRWGQLGIQLIVDGEVHLQATGQDSGAMRPEAFDVRGIQGKTAHLEIIDQADGGWGHTTVDYIVFADRPSTATTPEAVPGYGNMALAVLANDVLATADVRPRRFDDTIHPSPVHDLMEPKTQATGEVDALLGGALQPFVNLKPGEEATIDFLIAWWFPYYAGVGGEMAAITDMGKLSRYYARRFESAQSVVEYVAANKKRLLDTTRLWNKTWYDSTLPYWLLDRLFVPITTLATQTVHRFDNGRWWGWEGVDCCPGTCQHVWQYAHSAARIFPELERDLRERVDFGLAWSESGAMGFRAENDKSVATDGFCGTLLRVYREHQMSPDRTFLKRLWPRIRKSVEFILAQDGDGDGILEGIQMNTLDTPWEGPMAWMSSLFLAALEAGSAMATEMGDKEFAKKLDDRIALGRKNMVEMLFNGEYFIHKPPNFNRNNSNIGCHSDQLMGQAYAHQLGLPRIVPPKEAKSALNALWKYNFTPDVGPYRTNFKKVEGGRWYAMPGEAGMIVCTFPKGGGENAVGKEGSGFAGYFNEVWTGFEYQVAAHMVWEGLVTEGLAVCKAIHERHAPEKRNPYNEIECSDHYSRAMSSHGVFLALCGYEHHGPAGHLGFAPKVSPEKFKAPFTTCEGWGTYSQERTGKAQSHKIEVKYGRLRVKTLALEVPASWKQVPKVTVKVGVKELACKFTLKGRRLEIELGAVARLGVGQGLEVVLG